MTKVWVPVAYGSALVSYNFAQLTGWSFSCSRAPRAKLQATWWQNARASRSSLPTLPEREALGNLGRLRAVAVRRWRRLTMLNRRSLSDSRSNTQLGPAYYVRLCTVRRSSKQANTTARRTTSAWGDIRATQSSLSQIDEYLYNPTFFHKKVIIN